MTPEQHDRPAGQWRRVEQLDADRIADALNAAHRTGLQVDGPCPGGQVGAAYVRWPGGRRGVLKWRPAIQLEAVQRGPLAVVAALRDVGYPAPATELAVQLGDSVVLVQQLLPGTKIDYVDHRTLDQILALHGRHAGRLAGRADIPAMRLYLRGDGPGFCLHEPLRRFSLRSAALDRWVRAVGDAHPEHLPGDDAVHCDFHPENMLSSDGVLTAVVDWDGAARGDCRLDLVTLRFGLHRMRHAAGITDRLDAILDSFPPRILRPAWAHMSLRMADWAIRHFDPAEVEHWLDLAEQRAGS